MVSPSVGSVVLVRFPFSDLSASKLRPAVVLAGADRGDWILCQVTSNPYSDSHAIEITDTDFATGALMRTSYAKPGKIFTANASLMEREVGKLLNLKHAAIIAGVIAILRPTA
ncbi:MAG: type II toxin-antitoxin system PemK/MazF family toxin [bacterium]|jgi:mRNA interferase MazF